MNDLSELNGEPHQNAIIVTKLAFLTVQEPWP